MTDIVDKSLSANSSDRPALGDAGAVTQAWNWKPLSPALLVGESDGHKKGLSGNSC